MAKRKAARRAPAKKTASGRRRTPKARTGRKRAAVRRRATRKAVRKAVPRSTKATKATKSKKGAKGAKSAKGTRSTQARAAASRKAVSRRRSAARPAATRTAGRPKVGAARPPTRTAPGLNRERRIVQNEDIVPSPPSTLDLDRSASSVRSGRRELQERLDVHTETGPALTGGDIDADWESAYNVGDTAPGGDNPTPDQDIVDEIGRAVGVEYEDNEELKGEAKISDRDKHRWELDPASAEDFEDR
jgi:hypothetical protein